jgi:putative integral membrane protein (TIGR02587 family)
MEMWWLGVSAAPGRLALLLALNLPLLVGLSAVSGFEPTAELKHDVVDAFVAYAVGFAAAAAVLLLMGLVGPGMPFEEALRTVAIQTVPGSIGALLAQSQLGQKDEEAERRRESEGYPGEVFLMGVGALFLAFNVAPTEEVLLIAARMSEWHALAMVLLSLLIIHAFVYAVEFHGQSGIPEGIPRWSVFLRFTVVGYAVALLISAYVLWTFGRSDGLSASELASLVVVLGFPASVGAAAARLIL